MAFDLGAALKDVSKLDTGREQIEYIRLEQIEEDPNNFYQLSDVENLAANIELCGLQQPIRVRPIPEQEGRYMIVSGHRRRNALELLAKDNPDRWGEVACIVQREAVSAALQQLQLIYANSNTRTMTSAETSEQAVQVEKLLYQLKEEGYEFPGRMRDHVAQAVGASKSKLARLKVIREKLSYSWKQKWKSNKLGESVAYALAQLPVYWQDLIFAGCSDTKYLYEGTVQEYANRFKQIEATACGDRKDMECSHKTTMMEKSCKDRWSDPCKSRCCWNCISLRTCKDSCKAAEGRKKDLKAAHKADADAEARRVAERDAPKIQTVDALWQRFGLARELAGKEWKECKEVMGCSYFPLDDEKVMKLECGEAKVTPDTKLPYWIARYDIEKLLAVADLLGCSLDWLLCRTDVNSLTPKAVSNLGTEWQTGDPDEPGDYILMLQPYKGQLQFELWHWENEVWEDDIGEYNQDIDGDILGWIPMPKEKQKSACNDSCITGMSPTGHCGAAAYCDTEYSCCLQCPEPCNSQCGWISEQSEGNTYE